MHFVRSIFLVAAFNRFTVLVSHTLDTDNSIADSLSRLQMVRFCHLAPTADLESTQHRPFGTTLCLPFIYSHVIVDSTRRSYLAGIRRYTTFLVSDDPVYHH